MINTFRQLARVAQKPTTLFSCNRSISVSGFRQAAEKSDKSDTMEKQRTNKDATTHSFGEGYATRSDEEGFGGTQALDGNSAANKLQQDKMIHENHPAYDKTQGHEGTEKETGRHQKTRT